MDNIINRLSRQPGQPEQYKKFNPNPIPETQPTWDVPQLPEPQFPEYEEWTRQIESGERQPQFQPTEMPTEAGMPGLTLLDALGKFYQTENPMDIMDKFADLSQGEQGVLVENILPELFGYKPEEEEVEEPLPLPVGEETREDYIKRLLTLGATHSEAGGMANLLFVEEEELKVGDTGYTVADFVTWALENNKLYKDVIEALVKAGLEPTKAKDSLNAYLDSTQINLPLK